VASQDFSLALEMTFQTARRQSVKPVENIEDLDGQGDPADWEGFDEDLAHWRKEHPVH